MAKDWRSAYLEQAKSDHVMLQKLLQDEMPVCHCLHYLQMTTEKMAKGFLTTPGGPRYVNTHNAFVKFMTLAKGRPDIRAASPFKQPRQFAAYVKSLLDVAQRVENLSPEGGDHPNPEYPWEENGVVIMPVEYHFTLLDLRGSKMIKLLQFIEDCFRIV